MIYGGRLRKKIDPVGQFEQATTSTPSPSTEQADRGRCGTHRPWGRSARVTSGDVTGELGSGALYSLKLFQFHLSFVKVYSYPLTHVKREYEGCYGYGIK